MKRQLLLCFALILSFMVRAQLVGVINEAVFTGPLGANYPSGYTTYRIYALLQDPTDRLSAVYGSTAPSPTHHLKMGSCQPNSVWNTTFGGVVATAINCGFFAFFPESQWDSFVTVGRASSCSPGGT